MSERTSDKSIEELISGRRTIYAFKSSPVPPLEEIKQAINLARWAPNHYLTEPWHFYLVGPKTAKAIAQLNAELVGVKHGEKAAQIKLERWSKMPGWLVLTCNKSDDPVRAQEDYAACCCAVQNLMLYLWSLGIGVKWNTGDVIQESKFYDLIWVDPDAETVVGLFWYGYAEEVPNKARKQVDRFLIELP
ncbi:MAG: nitroreductase [Gammaproteobacteria bacterium]|nr:nitroreductase [Gammaproteobacteria bacterium]